MATQHPTIDHQPLNAALVSAELVTTSGTGPPRRELVLVFTDGTRNWQVKVHGVEVRNV